MVHASDICYVLVHTGIKKKNVVLNKFQKRKKYVQNGLHIVFHELVW
jgi:hypothetical protein